MNDDNAEEESRYVSRSQYHFVDWHNEYFQTMVDMICWIVLQINVEDCDLLVDLVNPDGVTSREPNYASQKKDWKIICEHQFLNSAKSHPFFRAFYIPWLSAEYTSYDPYVLLLNNKKIQQTKLQRRKKNRSVEDFDDSL